MSVDRQPIFGDVVAPAALRAPDAQSINALLADGTFPYARLIECRLNDRFDSLIVEIDVEVAQGCPRDLRPVETIAISMEPGVEQWPAVFMLRESFPRDLLHLACNSPGFPVGLCVTEQPYIEARSRWTPQQFIGMVRAWLERAAAEQLHAADQPLDGVLVTSHGQLIIPHRVLANPDQAKAAQIFRIDEDVLLLTDTPVLAGLPAKSDEFVLSMLAAPERVHGPMSLELPQTLAQLMGLLEATGWQCQDVFKQAVKDLRSVGHGNRRPIWLIVFPMKRSAADSAPERYDICAFVATDVVDKVAEDLGLAWSANGKTATIIKGLGNDQGTGGQKTPIHVLNPLPTLSVSAAANFNSLEVAPRKRTVAIGCGALGSQILGNALRAGFVPSHVIDADRLFPHNLARHELTSHFLGVNKAKAFSIYAKHILDEATDLQPIDADVVTRGEKEETVLDALRGAELILDFSASVEAARCLSHDKTLTGRRISMFVNPSGSDLVMLAEDPERHMTLDRLEAQYYWQVATKPSFAGHLQSQEQVRFARSCRDLSNKIPQSRMATLAGIGSELVLRAASDQPVPMAATWRIDGVTMAVSYEEIPVFPMIEMTLGEWTVSIARDVLAQIRAWREEQLPNETGGCLVGSWDGLRKQLHVVGVLPAPSDSESSETSFERGHVDMPEKFAEIRGRTLGMLTYLGEWHSHTEKVSPLPSPDDIQLYGWMADHMSREGYPAVMLIVAAEQFASMISGEGPTSVNS